MRKCIMAIIAALGLLGTAAPAVSAEKSKNLWCVHYSVTKYYKPDAPLRIVDDRVYGSVSKWTIWLTFEVLPEETCETGKPIFSSASSYHVNIVTKRYSWRDNGKRGRFKRVLLDQSYRLCPWESNVYGEPRNTPC